MAENAAGIQKLPAKNVKHLKNIGDSLYGAVLAASHLSIEKHIRCLSSSSLQGSERWQLTEVAELS